MLKKYTIIISSSLFLALLLLDKLGIFKNPILGTGVVILILLGFPIAWQIKEYIKKKYPKAFILTECPFCGLGIPEEANHCGNCGKSLEEGFIDYDEFSEDIKVKKICPYCGLKELETIYEISRGYREVCASCGKSRVSRKALKITFLILAYLLSITLIFYWFFQIHLK